MIPYARHLGRTAVLCAVLASFAAHCLAMKVQTVLGKGVDLASYKTYQWLPPKLLAKTGLVEDDPVIAPAIKEAVNRELTARGLREVAQGGDLLVSTVALAVSTPQLEAVLLAPVSPSFVSVPLATTGRYNREGTLAINLIDSRTKTTAWAAAATDSIDNKPGAGQKKIPKAAAAMFKKYPVPK
jgi:hypothetical protein